MKMHAYGGENFIANSSTRYFMFNMTVELKVVILKHKLSHFDKIFSRDFILFPSVRFFLKCTSWGILGYNPTAPTVTSEGLSGMFCKCFILFIKSNDYDKTYFQLLDISKKPSMEVKRLRILITEIFKTLHDSNPVFMKDIFHYCQNKSHKKHNLHVHSRNTSRYGNNSFRVLGAHIWDSLPENVKCTDSINELKNFLKGWYVCKWYLRIV